MKLVLIAASVALLVSLVGTPFLIRAALGGSDAVAIAAEFNNPIYSLVAKPEIKSFAGLKGKLIGLAYEAGTITLSIRKLLALRGLGKDDFRFKTIELILSVTEANVSSGSMTGAVECIGPSVYGLCGSSATVFSTSGSRSLNFRIRIL